MTRWKDKLTRSHERRGPALTRARASLLHQFLRTRPLTLRSTVRQGGVGCYTRRRLWLEGNSTVSGLAGRIGFRRRGDSTAPGVRPPGPVAGRGEGEALPPMSGWSGSSWRHVALGLRAKLLLAPCPRAEFRQRCDSSALEANFFPFGGGLTGAEGSVSVEATQSACQGASSWRGSCAEIGAWFQPMAADWHVRGAPARHADPLDVFAEEHPLDPPSIPMSLPSSTRSHYDYIQN